MSTTDAFLPEPDRAPDVEAAHDGFDDESEIEVERYRSNGSRDEFDDASDDDDQNDGHRDTDASDDDDQNDGHRDTDDSNDDDVYSTDVHSADAPPFRTPEAGDRMTAADLAEELDVSGS